MTRLLGVVASSGSDWTLADVLPIFTINGATFGFAMAIFIGGLGVALGYLAPMALLQRWYPDARGFAAGVSVAGFGELSFIYRYILRDHAHSLTRSP